jgi:hypothetical protein
LRSFALADRRSFNVTMGAELALSRRERRASVCRCEPRVRRTSVAGQDTSARQRTRRPVLAHGAPIGEAHDARDRPRHGGRPDDHRESPTPGGPVGAGRAAKRATSRVFVLGTNVRVAPAPPSDHPVSANPLCDEGAATELAEPSITVFVTGPGPARSSRPTCRPAAATTWAANQTLA